jgi:hypothetical protein
MDFHEHGILQVLVVIVLDVAQTSRRGHCYHSMYAVCTKEQQVILQASASWIYQEEGREASWI